MTGWLQSGAASVVQPVRHCVGAHARMGGLCLAVLLMHWHEGLPHRGCGEVPGAEHCHGIAATCLPDLYDRILVVKMRGFH